MKLRKSITALAAAVVTLSSALTVSAADYTVNPGYPIPTPPSNVPVYKPAPVTVSPAPSAPSNKPASADKNGSGANNAQGSAPVELIDGSVDISKLCSGEPVYASYKNTEVKSSAMAALARLNDTVLKIVTKRYTISIDSSTVREAKDINLGMAMTKNTKAGAMIIRTMHKGEYGCTLNMTVSAKYYSQCGINLNKANVYYVDEAGAAHRLGRIILDDVGNIVIPMTFGGKYIIK